MNTSLNNLLLKNLIDFGLTKKEANVYLALIELEIATVSQIAENTTINRSSTYVVLGSLRKKGLVSVSEDKKVQQFVAISPDMLFEEAKNRAKKAEEIRNNINDIIPELKALHKDTKQKPKIKVFEGKQSLINAINDQLNSKEKIIRECSATNNILKIIPDNVIPIYINKRIELGIILHGIHPDDKTEEKFTKTFPELSKLDKSVFIPKEKYQFPADVAIYDNKIAYLSPEKRGFAIIIESKEMADVMKNIFDLAYAEAKRLAKKKKK